MQAGHDEIQAEEQLRRRARCGRRTRKSSRGTRPSCHSLRYSMPLMREEHERRARRSAQQQPRDARAAARAAAARTASAMVKLLVSSTAVLIVPSHDVGVAARGGERRRGSASAPYSVARRTARRRTASRSRGTPTCRACAASRCCTALSNCSRERRVRAHARLALRRRRRRAPRSTTGVASKLSFGGGEGVRHSRPVASHGLRRRALAVQQRPAEIDERQQVADREDRRARRRQHVQHLELRRVLVIAPRHARVAEQVLREEREVEAEEDQDRGERAPSFSGYSRPVIFGHQKWMPPR